MQGLDANRKRVFELKVSGSKIPVVARMAGVIKFLLGIAHSMRTRPLGRPQGREMSVFGWEALALRLLRLELSM